MSESLSGKSRNKFHFPLDNRQYICYIIPMTAKELKNFNIEDYATVEEAAILVGLKETSIRMYLSQGKLVTYKLKSLTLVKRDELRRWKTDHSKN